MTKADVISTINKFKDKPFMIGFGEGTRFYGNIEGCYIFESSTGIVQVRKNAANYNEAQIDKMSQKSSPYRVSYGDYASVTIITGFPGNTIKDIKDAVNGLTLAGTTKTIGDITDELVTDKIFLANSPRGYSNSPYTNSDYYGKKQYPISDPKYGNTNM